MTLKPIAPNLELFPDSIRPFLEGAKLYDSSCSEEARVIFIDRDGGYFLKSMPAGKLLREAEMTRYFHGKGLAARVLDFVSAADRDWMLTERVPGEDCCTEKYLENPERLCDIIAERLALLHSMDYSDCPVANHTERYLALADHNKRNDIFDKSLFPDNWGYTTPEEAWSVIETRGHLLKTDTLLHGDYCLPNIMLNDWHFNGFVDIGAGGVGDRHIDIFWGMWSLYFNLKTVKYRDRFLDAYGRDRIDEDMLRVVSAVEVFA